MSDERRLPLKPIDGVAVDDFWDGFKAAKHLENDVRYAEAFQFGDHHDLADKLADLVLHGPKRATAGTIAELEADDAKLPEVGDLWVVCRGDGTPCAVIESTDVRVGPLSSVDEQFAWDEGEGDRSRADWLRMHTDCFTRSYARLGIEMHDDIDVIFERFALVYAE